MNAQKGGRFRLVVKEGSSEWEFFIEKKSFTLGRTNKSTVCIPMQILSSIHLELTHVNGNKWFVSDKGSTNGSFVKDKKMEPEKPYQMSSPFSLRVGQKTELIFQITDLVEGDVSSRDDLKTKELSKEADRLIVAPAVVKVDLDLERKNKEAERRYHEIEKELQDKTNLKNFLSDDILELQRKLALLVEQEDEIKKSIQAYRLEESACRDQRDKSRNELDQVLKKKEVLSADLDLQKASFEELKLNASDQEKKLKEAFDKEAEAHKELHKSLRLITEKEEQLVELSEKFESAKKLLSEKNASIDSLNLQLETLKRVHAQEESELHLLSSKLLAAKESMQLIDSQRKTSEAAMDTLRAELLAAEGKLKRLNSETHEMEDKATRLRSDINAQLHKSQDLEEKISRLEKSESNLQKEHSAHLENFKFELGAIERAEKEKLQSFLQESKRNYDLWEKEEREKLNLELKVRKDDVHAWESAEKDRLQKQFISQAEKLEKDLAERKQKELLEIDELRAKWNREREAKRPLEIKEIVRSSIEILGAHLINLKIENDKHQSLLDVFKKDLEGVVRSVLVSGASAKVETHLKAALVQSPENTLKAKQKRKIWAIQVGSALGLLLVCLIFPQIPQTLWETGTSVFRRDPQSADIFVERIRLARLNRPKFMPQRDRVFRNTYTDNIIYLEDYAEIKSDPDIKKAWTLALNQFFVKELDMDERIIVAFMAIESPLVRELTEMSTKIQIKNQESDISRMRAFEDLSTPRLIEVVQGRENYDKFRNFEMKFYDEYSNKLIVPDSAP